MTGNDWYKLDLDEVSRSLRTDPIKGLAEHEAAFRLRRHGPNLIKNRNRSSVVKLFFRQFNDALTYVLIISAGLSLAVGLTTHENSQSTKEAILIGFIILINALIGFVNEYRAESTVQKLRSLVGQKAQVRRSGQVVSIDVTDIVPGDIILVEAGQKIPADARLVMVNELTINESTLSGESLPASKQTLVIRRNAELADRTNMLLAGTFVASGRGEAIVVATGQQTELGKIANLVSHTVDTETPLQTKLDALGKKIGIIATVLCGLVFVVILIFTPDHASESWLTRAVFAFTAAVALAVAVVPEGLAIVVRISLALGARRMAKSNALVRHLSAVEALGSTDVICTDKTGTLTTGEMSLTEVRVGGRIFDLTQEAEINKLTITDKKLLRRLLLTGALCNNASMVSSTDSTETALILAAQKYGVDVSNLATIHPRLAELPFSSEAKKMSTLHHAPNGYLSAHKGALESILKLSSHYIDEAGVRRKLTAEQLRIIDSEHDAMASEALRVLAFAASTYDEKPGKDEIESGLTFIGLGGLFDPPRPEVAEVLHRIQFESGLRVIMITGDHVETARAVARQIGLKGKVIEGVELDKLNRRQLENQIEQIAVFARVNPEHKIRIVEALKKHGHQVAMTGDGVNDAPAIKAANVGIAMGITGSDVAKEAADLTLLDDRFVTIVSAIEEGRGIYDNVQKFVNFLLSCNIAEFAVVLFGLLFFHDLLLTASQILFINIVTDGLPAIALGSDPVKKSALKDSPENYQRPIITRRLWLEMLIFAVAMSVAVLVPHHMLYRHSSTLLSLATVMAGVVVHEMARLIDIRTDYQIKWFSNPWLSISMLSSVAALCLVLYVPSFSNYFSLMGLSLYDWGVIVTASVGLFVLMQFVTPAIKNLIAIDK